MSKKTKTIYIIVRAEDHIELMHEVNNLISQKGFLPIGGVTNVTGSIERQWAQAMIKPKV